MNVSALATPVTLVLPFGHNVEAHRLGCKAASRRVRRFETEVVRDSMPVATLIEMMENPDEGHIKIHGCLQLIVAAGLLERRLPG